MLRQSKINRSFKALSASSIKLPSVSKRPIFYKSIRCPINQLQVNSQCFQPAKLLSLYQATSHSSKNLWDLKSENHKSIVKAYSTVKHDSNNNEHTMEDDIDMTKSIRSELMTIKDTFSMKEVPRDSLYIGAAGILPYAATSCSTIYIAWDINYAEENGVGYLLSPESAHQLLNIITPIQIGYGAIIISFLGAVHWGLEYAGFGGRHSYRRLKYGVIAPIIAWPTLLMPVETALISQFLAFNYMYFVDARATAEGWFPPWYSIYRFVLTFFVGASIVVSLISRGQIERPEQQQLKTLKEQANAEREAQFVNLESEEIMRREEQEMEDEEGESNGEDEESEINKETEEIDSNEEEENKEE
ncbi:hypothetical protein HI914_03109 [Erysiphe necator]|nr:hypothetical protein HI914_03109 [Erysiphe necator]